MLGLFTNFYHIILEQKQDKFYENILEIGAGNGEHLKYVKSNYTSYILLDLKFKSDVKKNLRKVHPNIKFVESSVEEMPFANAVFDRIIITCVLHHVINVDRTVCEIVRVLKPGGQVNIYLPCDPGMLYRWIRHFGSHIKHAKISRNNLKTIKFLWANEHRNNFLSILSILKYYMPTNLSIKSFPFPFLSWNFNLFKIIKWQKPQS